MLTLALLFAALTSPPAYAGGPELKVSSLHLERTPSVTVVHYAVHPDSWGAMGGASGAISLDLRLRSPDGTPGSEFTVALSAPVGGAPFALPRGSETMEIEVWLTVRGQPVAMDLSGTLLDRATLSPQASAPSGAVSAAGGGGSWGQDPGVIEACGDTFSSGDRQDACVKAVERWSTNPAPIIALCNKQFESDVNELACLQHLSGVAYDPTAAIDACTAAMEGDSKELECLSYAGMATTEPSGVIQACDKARSGDTEELACVRERLSP